MIKKIIHRLGAIFFSLGALCLAGAVICIINNLKQFGFFIDSCIISLILIVLLQAFIVIIDTFDN